MENFTRLVGVMVFLDSCRPLESDVTILPSFLPQLVFSPTRVMSFIYQFIVTSFDPTLVDLLFPW